MIPCKNREGKNGTDTHTNLGGHEKTRGLLVLIRRTH
jgi:hypothetical protein